MSKIVEWEVALRALDYWSSGPGFESDFLTSFISWGIFYFLFWKIISLDPIWSAPLRWLPDGRHRLGIIRPPRRVSCLWLRNALPIRDWQMQFYIRSKPISVGFSINDRLNYIALYIIGKGIKYPNLSPFHGLWQFYFNRGLQRQKTATCKKTINIL